jgi:hypothetical protein
LNTNDDLFIAGRIEVDGLAWFDGQVNHMSTTTFQDTSNGAVVYDDVPFGFGTAYDSVFEYDTNQTVDSLALGLDETSRSLIICDKGDRSYNKAHSGQSHPTIFLHSANQSTTQWGSLAHNGTDFVIDAGTGNIKTGTDIDLDENSIRFDPSPGTNQTGHGLIVEVTVTTNTQGFGNQMTLNASWQWVDADSDDDTTMPAIATALDSGTGANKRLLLHGIGIIRDDAWNWSRTVSGEPGFIFVSTTSGDLTQTRPSGTGDYVQPVGFPLSADIMLVLPCHTLVKIA